MNTIVALLSVGTLVALLRWRRGSRLRSSPDIRVVSLLDLSPHHRVALISFRGRDLLVGMTTGSFAVLAPGTEVNAGSGVTSKAPHGEGGNLKVVGR